MRSDISSIRGRSPNASMMNSTPGCGPSLSGSVRYASATPSAVGMSTVEVGMGPRIARTVLWRQSSTRGHCTGDDPGTSCTEVQLTLGTVDQAVPYDGVVTGWAVRDAGGQIALRVVDRPAGQRRVVAPVR